VSPLSTDQNKGASSKAEKYIRHLPFHNKVTATFLGIDPQLSSQRIEPELLSRQKPDSGRFRAIAGGRFIGSHTS
jgi:hypothetical protein